MSGAVAPTAGSAKSTRWLIVRHGSVGSALVRRIGRTEVARALGATPVGLGEGLADVGLVFLHTSLEKETARMIDAVRLRQMQSGTLLVNTALIGLLDEAAVAGAISSGHLGGAGFDAKLAPDSPLRRLSADLAAEWAPRGIRVNVVAPGVVATSFLGNDRTRLDAWVAERVPSGRTGTPEEVANVVRYVALDAPDYLVGARIAVDGGTEAIA
jgi:NAD(P)-dependent dehydrogenase (short-subunit alcohol dehydrogenase family)